MREELVTLVIKAFQEISEQQDLTLAAPPSEETPLFGSDGLLDSMGLVTLVVAVEQAIEDTFGISTSLADERALSQRNSPFRTIGTLADYAHAVINATASNG